MEFAYSISGAAPLIKSYFASATMSTAGVWVEGADVANTDIGGVVIQGTALANATESTVGLTVSTTGTIAATGITDSSVLMVKVIVNPDAVCRAKLSGAATEDTALEITTTTSADATGVNANGTTTIDEGVLWAYTGANVGEIRRCDDVTGSVTVNFPKAIASGDTFIAAVGFAGYTGSPTGAFLDFSTLGSQLVGQTTDSDNDNLVILDWELRDASDSGSTNSFYHILSNNHAFGGNPQHS